MLQTGALEEVEALAALQLDPGLPVMRALGVAPLIEHLRGRLDRAAAAEAVTAQTRQYAKRQVTWARSNMITWSWVQEQESESLIRKILSFVDV
jgi:tRNA dimethylallyltransferase